ncbi:hypothetical protein [Brevibacterium renqingii]|uniref:hypothetical protein n=1 Tax=Brevibacterium renqingii TaxID=2776916 RepID=UPI001ADFE7CA|nr:hypothetical protein [Brevibacterium renqingii]
MRFPVSRRVLLTTGVSGASLALLTACGLRLDADPELPTLDSSQRLRNRIARILASTTPGSGDPDTAGEDLDDFVTAIGPVWNPPTELATEPPPSEDERSFLEAAEVVSRVVFDAAPELGSGLIPVLTDVATGLTLTAGTKEPELIRTADELIRAGREEGSDAAGTASAGHGSRRPKAPEDRQSMFNAILNQSRAAAYGYERLAVNFARKSAERTGALARLESLGSLSGEMLELLGEDNADPNASAWQLDPTPTDTRTARELALGLEDGLAAALLPWLESETSAILRLWESARARTVFSQPQPLRFTYSGSGRAGSAEARASAPTATPAGVAG